MATLTHAPAPVKLDTETCTCGDSCCKLCADDHALALGIEIEIRAATLPDVPPGFSVVEYPSGGYTPWMAFGPGAALGPFETVEEAAAACRADRDQHEHDTAPCRRCQGEGWLEDPAFGPCPECGGAGSVYDPGWRERLAQEWAAEFREWVEAIDRNAEQDATAEVEEAPYTAADEAHDTWFGLGYAMVPAVVPARWADAYAAGRRAAETEELARIVAWDDAVAADR